MKIGEILRDKQPEAYKKLNKKKHRRHKKERKHREEHLSFSDFDRIMRNNRGIDESKCKAR